MILAWIGAIFIGLTLGLLGSGGSILTVPVLIYLVGEPSKLAIAESLAIVGAISLFAAIPYALNKQIDWRSVIMFGLPGVVGTYLGAMLSQYMSGVLQLILFAVVMLLASSMMLKPKPKAQASASTTSPTHQPPRSPVQIGAEGLVVGIITGLVGVGGGFLIIPALVLLGRLPMSLAVGTSLVIIAAKSFAGFYKYVDVLAQQNLSIHWDVVILIAALGMIGSLVGSRINSKFSNESLRRVFAIFLIGMGIYVLANNIPKVL